MLSPCCPGSPVGQKQEFGVTAAYTSPKTPLLAAQPFSPWGWGDPSETGVCKF